MLLIWIHGCVRDAEIQEMDNTSVVKNGEERLHASVSEIVNIVHSDMSLQLVS
jgi:hypothetical protein